MTTKEMKELYATGEWICVYFGIAPETSHWYLEEMASFEGSGTYKLIHIKHKEALDHVLSGGKVLTYVVFKEIQDVNDFIKYYHKDNIYEIIPTKQDLNGHYCLATKEHYEQLVKDGYACDTKYGGKDIGYYTKFFYIHNLKIIQHGIDTFNKARETTPPMHYHNNQWNFGSLEHEEATEINSEWNNEITICCAKCGASADDCICPKPPKRITREEYQKALLDNVMINQPDFTRMLNESMIKDAYIASLEANQKDK